MDPRSSAAVQKNQKVLEKSDVHETKDRISNLPDGLLSQILSLLPTKNAVQTSVLSTRWKDIWPFVNTFDFEMRLWRYYKGDRRYFDNYEKRLMTSFANSVDRLLVLRDNMSIEKFCYLGTTTTEFTFSHLYAWVSAVLMSNVRDLYLDLSSKRYEFPCELPQSLFTCKTLDVLKLVGEFLLDVPFYVSLPRLKTLHLKSIIYLDDALTQRFFSSCSVLEDLTIERPVWDNACTFNVSVPSLRRLTLDIFSMEEELYHDMRYDYKLVVNAPKLEYFKLVDYSSEYITVNKLPFLVEADISIHKSYNEEDWGEGDEYRDWEDDEVHYYRDWGDECDYGDRAYDVIRAMSNAARLSLSGYTLQSLCNASSSHLPKFQNLIQLKFGFDQWNGAVLLPSFLKSSPKLETLLLPEGITNIEEMKYDVNKDIFFDYKWKAPKQVPECLLFSLKTIEIHCFCGAKKEDLKVVKYLLSNAMVLEKMTILCHYSPVCDCFMSSFSFKDEVLKYPRGSSGCKLGVYTPQVTK